jgi:hypothetical protein
MKLSYSVALLLLMEYSRSSKDMFEFGPMDLAALENQGLVISGPDLAGAQKVLAGIPGLYLSDELEVSPSMVQRRGSVSIDVSLEGTCGRWMPLSKICCGLPLNHFGTCRTPGSAARRRGLATVNSLSRNVRRRRMLAAIKQTAGCVDCNYDAHPAALDFDHVGDDLKRGNISQMLTVTLENLFAEVMKTEVVCANCHRVRTAQRRGSASGW